MMDTNISPSVFARSISTKMFPQTIGDMLDYSDWMWTHFGTYTEALKNAVRYFLGEITVQPADVDKTLGGRERAEATEELIGGYRIFELLGRVGDEYVQWGNSFTSVELPTKRKVTCPRCGLFMPATEVGSLRYGGGGFTGSCPSCRHTGAMPHVDSPDTTSPMRVVFWNPRAVSITYSPVTKSKRYTINPPSSWTRAFQEGDSHFFAETPLEILKALDTGGVLEIDPAYFKHLATPSPSTMEDLLHGWGLPLFMSEFETVIQLQMMKRYNEAILSDFVVPWRVLSPPPTGAGQVEADPLGTLDMGGFRTQMQRMVASHRMNPTDVQVAPFPVSYQIFGGEASKLIPLDIEDSIITRLLNSMCIPVEFKVMSMTNTSGPPTGLRRFEKVWATHVAALDGWLQWFCDCRTDLLRAQALKVRLVKSSIYEDDLSREYKVKLGMGNAISFDTAFKPLGIDYTVEMAKMQDERNFQMEMEERNQAALAAAEELKAGMGGPPTGSQQLMAHQQAQMGGMPPQDGMPPPQGMPPQPSQPGQAADLESLWAEAEVVAEQIRVLPSDQRRSQLVNLKKTNPPLHAFVKQIIETTEQQAAQQGVAASRQPQ